MIDLPTGRNDRGIDSYKSIEDYMDSYMNPSVLDEAAGRNSQAALLQKALMASYGQEKGLRNELNTPQGLSTLQEFGYQPVEEGVPHLLDRDTTGSVKPFSKDTVAFIEKQLFGRDETQSDVDVTYDPDSNTTYMDFNDDIDFEVPFTPPTRDQYRNDLAKALASIAEGSGEMYGSDLPVTKDDIYLDEDLSGAASVVDALSAALSGSTGQARIPTKNIVKSDATGMDKFNQLVKKDTLDKMNMVQGTNMLANALKRESDIRFGVKDRDFRDRKQASSSGLALTEALMEIESIGAKIQAAYGKNGLKDNDRLTALTKVVGIAAQHELPLNHPTLKPIINMLNR